MKNKKLVVLALFFVLLAANCSKIGIGSKKQKAENLGKNELGKYLAKCQSSWYLDRLTRGPFELKNEGFTRLREIPLSEVDKLNGFEYKAVFSYDYFGPQREFSGYARGWKQWEQGTQAIDIEIICNAGQWQASKSRDLFRGATYKELGCEAKSLKYPLAIEAFRKDEDPKSIPTMIELWTDILQSVKDKNSFGNSYNESEIQEAVRMLVKYYGNKSVGLFGDVLRNCGSRHHQVGTEIIRFLADFNDKGAVPALTWAMPEKKEWVSIIAEALLKLDAKESQGALKELLARCIEKHWDRYYSSDGPTISDISPYLKALSIFSGEPWSSQDWTLISDRLNELSNLHRSARGYTSNYYDIEYRKAVPKLRNIASSENFDQIRDWVFPVIKRENPAIWQSAYDMTPWEYGEISQIYFQENKIQIVISRHRSGQSKALLDSSVIILKPDNEKYKIFNIVPVTENPNPDHAESPSN